MFPSVSFKQNSQVKDPDYPIRKNAYSKLIDLALVDFNPNGYTDFEMDLADGELPAAVDYFRGEKPKFSRKRLK